MLRFVINERYIKMFQFINNKSPSMRDIAKHTRFHYPHILTVLKQFQEEGLIKPIFNQDNAEHKSKPGNPYIIELTPKGKTVTKLLNLLYRLHTGTDEKEILNELKEKGGKNERNRSKI